MDRFEKIIGGIMILKKYGKGAFNLSAEHDQIWAGWDEYEDIAGEDLKRLKDLGWWIDEGVDCWTRFV